MEQVGEPDIRSHSAKELCAVRESMALTEVAPPEVVHSRRSQSAKELCAVRESTAFIDAAPHPLGSS